VLIIGLALPAGAAAAVKTGQSPDCKRFCMSVEPREALEGSVFRIKGRGWLPHRRVEVFYGPYCRPAQACPDVAYIAHLRTNRRGGFSFRVRAGASEPGDAGRGIVSGGHPGFSQWRGKPHESRLVQRSPRYSVIVPGCGDCG
jgi:hypothetical protein